MASFDDKKFSKKAAKLGLVPKVFVPKNQNTLTKLTELLNMIKKNIDSQ